MQIYIHHNGQQLGPFTEAEVRAQLASGAISGEDHAWWEGQANWAPLKFTPLLVTPFQNPPVPPLMPLTPLAPPMPGIPTHTYAESLAMPRTSNLAIWSLVCSIAGILGCCCCINPAIIGVVLGHLALNDIKKNPAVQGKGMATAGLIIGYIALVFCVVLQIINFTGGLGERGYGSKLYEMIEEQQAIIEKKAQEDSKKDNDTPPDSTTNAAPTPAVDP